MDVCHGALIEEGIAGEVCYFCRFVGNDDRPTTTMSLVRKRNALKWSCRSRPAKQQRFGTAAHMPPTMARLVGRTAAIMLAVPIDWVTARHLNLKCAGLIAVQCNNLHQVRQCLAAQPTPSIAQAWFHLSYRNVAIMKVLCAVPGVRPAARDNQAVRWAASQNSLDVVRFLCGLPQHRGVWPGAGRNKGFAWAAFNGHIDMVRFLCELPAVRGVNPGAEHNLALVWAAEQGHLDVVEYLCSLPAERHVDPASNNFAALQFSARHGHLDVVKILCATTATQRIHRCHILSASRAASRRGHTEVVRFLARVLA